MHDLGFPKPDLAVRILAWLLFLKRPTAETMKAVMLRITTAVNIEAIWSSAVEMARQRPPVITDDEVAHLDRVAQECETRHEAGDRKIASAYELVLLSLREVYLMRGGFCGDIHRGGATAKTELEALRYDVIAMRAMNEAISGRGAC